jgi:hypothetical protein
MHDFWKRLRYVHVKSVFSNGWSLFAYVVVGMSCMIGGAFLKFSDPLTGPLLMVVFAIVSVSIVLFVIAVIAAAFDDIQVVTNLERDSDGSWNMSGITNKKGKVVFIIPREVLDE